MSGKLTTHVLNTAQGIPAAGMSISLWKIEAGEQHLMKQVITNADGRTDLPLLAEAEFGPGSYELRFEVGAYFATTGSNQSDPPFLDQVPIRFGISDGRSHYHVPLLVSPWAYSTYRGS